jgi:hypothetical protein
MRNQICTKLTIEITTHDISNQDPQNSLKILNRQRSSTSSIKQKKIVAAFCAMSMKRNSIELISLDLIRSCVHTLSATFGCWHFLKKRREFLRILLKKNKKKNFCALRYERYKGRGSKESGEKGRSLGFDGCSVCLLSTLCCRQSGDYPQEESAQIWLQARFESNFFETCLSSF